MRRGVIFTVLWGILLSLAIITKAEERGTGLIPTPLTKNLGDVYVSIGVFSIRELEEKLPRTYKFLVKHHGEPKSSATHHVAVSVWNQREGKIEYLSDYKVEVEVRSPIFRAVRKKLTRYPHQYGDNYGGWFDMSDKGLYHIGVILRKDGKEKRVSFDYLIQ